VLGTPHFMAPEIVKEPEAAGVLSDIYAIGAVAYYLLSASLVFDGDTPMDVCVAQVTEPPQPLSERCSVPADLEQVVMACLAKDPSHRPSSVDRLASSLSACAAYGEWTSADADMWWRTRDPASTA